MPPTPLVVLEIDDNTPADRPPFSNDASMWSFADDLNLYTRTAEETFRRVHRLAGSVVFRGYPPNRTDATLALFGNRGVRPTEVTWLTSAELPGDRAWLPDGPGEVDRSVRMLFETVEVAARHFGRDRVRLVFAFV